MALLSYVRKAGWSGVAAELAKSALVNQVDQLTHQVDDVTTDQPTHQVDDVTTDQLMTTPYSIIVDTYL